MSVYRDLLASRPDPNQHSAEIDQSEMLLPKIQVLPVVDQLVDNFNAKGTQRFCIIGLDHKSGTTTIARQVAILLAERTKKTRVLLLHANLDTTESAHSKPEPLLLNNDATGLDILLGLPAKNDLEALVGAYDIILVDSPPLNSPDAMRILRWVQVVFPIIMANQTSHSNASVALERFRAIPVDVSGLILNRRTYHIPQAIYSRL
jgi:hypothetical protein